MVKWNIIGKNNGDYFPTIAGLILFGKEGLSEYEYASLRITKFEGVSLTNISDSYEFGLPILKNIDFVFNTAIRLLKKESYLEGAKRLQRTIIPDFAVREAIINAIVHRDYSIRGSSTKINIFDNRMEVISPGTLYGNLDISDLGTGLSESRNRAMVRFFRKMNLMEELGTGIARILALYRERNLKKPEFLEQSNFFRVILYQEDKLEKTGELIFELIKDRIKIGAAEIAAQLNLHHNTVLYHLKNLQKDNRIRKIGKGSKTFYTTTSG